MIFTKWRNKPTLVSNFTWRSH